MGLQDDLNKVESAEQVAQAAVDPFYVKAVAWVRAHAPQVVIGLAVLVALYLWHKA